MTEDIRTVVYEVLKDDMAIDLEDIDPTRPLAPLADTDDWSFIFCPEVERRLGISVPVEAWSKAGTVNEVVKMLDSFVQSQSHDT